MKTKDQILLENIYSSIKPMSKLESFFTDEADILDVTVKKLLNEFIDKALKNPNVLDYYSKNYSLSLEDLDSAFYLIHKLIIDFLKQSSHVKIENSSTLDKISWENARKFSKN